MLSSKKQKKIQEINNLFREILKKMHRQITCINCGGSHANWRTLKKGTFICIGCAQKLKEDNKIM